MNSRSELHRRTLKALARRRVGFRIRNIVSGIRNNHRLKNRWWLGPVLLAAVLYVVATGAYLTLRLGFDFPFWPSALVYWVFCALAGIPAGIWLGSSWPEKRS